MQVENVDRFFESHRDCNAILTLAFPVGCDSKTLMALSKDCGRCSCLVIDEMSPILNGRSSRSAIDDDIEERYDLSR
jgi:hypothetical protein